MIQNEQHIEAHEQKLDSYTGGINAALLGSLLLRSDKVLTISTEVSETANSKATTLANGIISKDEFIACVKEEEEILISNEWKFIGGTWQLNEDNRVSTDVSSLKGLYDASIPQEEEIESHIDGEQYASMKDSVSLHLVPLIDCTKLDRDSNFDLIKNKSRRR